ncbi:hypothetical protein KSP39_PZI019354 [Platanthera zijinensis]|uniref:Uncharacterized protein n=1 Tax=Platanthera zijinensis TaxID=2320716 RepID=A0AAP0FY59_9ASPA
MGDAFFVQIINPSSLAPDNRLQRLHTSLVTLWELAMPKILTLTSRRGLLKARLVTGVKLFLSKGKQVAHVLPMMSNLELKSIVDSTRKIEKAEAD